MYDDGVREVIQRCKLEEVYCVGVYTYIHTYTSDMDKEHLTDADYIHTYIYTYIHTYIYTYTSDMDKEHWTDADSALAPHPFKPVYKEG